MYHIRSFVPPFNDAMICDAVYFNQGLCSKIYEYFTKGIESNKFEYERQLTIEVLREHSFYFIKCSNSEHT